MIRNIATAGGLCYQCVLLRIDPAHEMRIPEHLRVQYEPLYPEHSVVRSRVFYSPAGVPGTMQA